MARGRKKGKQSWGEVSKAAARGKWLHTLRSAHAQVRRSNASSSTAAAATAPAPNEHGGWIHKLRQRRQMAGNNAARMNAHSAARFIELYLGGPPLASAAALTGGKAGLPMEKEDEDHEEDIALEDWLLKEAKKDAGDDEVADDEDDDEVEEEENAPLRLTELCCRQVGADLPVYGAAAAATAAADDSEDTAEAILGIFSLLPNECLERIALAASMEHAVDDNALALLCQPTVVRLVLVGTFTDDGLARAMFPRLRQLPQTASWEDPALEPKLRGCVALQSLLLSSQRLTPRCVEGIGRQLHGLTSLALPRCFNADVTTSAKEVLQGIGRACGYVQELDLRGCQWLSEKSLLGWAGASAAKEGGGGPPPALRRLYLDKRLLVKGHALRTAFWEVKRGEGEEKRKKEVGGIEVRAWET